MKSLLLKIQTVTSGLIKQESIQCLDAYNYVVVDKDFIYSVSSNGNSADVSIINWNSTPTQFREKDAIEVSKYFKARNGKGEIEFTAMKVREFYRKLIEHNEKLIEQIKEIV